MRGPLAHWNPDRDCWETNQLDLLSGQPAVWSETWSQSGMTYAGELYELPTSVPHTSVPGCSLLATPTASLGTCGGPQEPVKRRAGGHSVTLQDQVSAMPST